MKFIAAHWVEGLILLVIAVAVISIIAAGIQRDTVKVIDGCQYISHFTGREYVLIHKGNCTNAIHLR